MTVKLLNKDRLISRFRKLVPNAKKELAQASMEAAEEVADLARRFCMSASVRRTIHVEPNPKRLGARVVAGDASTLVEVRKGSGQFINLARIEEFGTKPHRLGGMFKGALHPGSKPRAFLFPAARLLKRKTKSKMGRAIGKAARAVGGR